jgi:hypothetical protein
MRLTIFALLVSSMVCSPVAATAQTGSAPHFASQQARCGRFGDNPSLGRKDENGIVTGPVAIS